MSTKNIRIPRQLSDAVFTTGHHQVHGTDDGGWRSLALGIVIGVVLGAALALGVRT